MLKRCTESWETGIVEQTGSQTGPVLYIRYAARLLAIVNGIYEACGLPMTGPPQLKEIPDLPPWAKNICEQLSKTIFKRLVELQPMSERVDWRNTGRLFGVWQRLITFLADEWKDAECFSPGEGTAPPTAPPESFVAIPQCDLLETVRDSLTGSIVDSLALAPADQNEFLVGLHEGHEMFLDTNDQFVGDRGRTRVYLVMLGKWMEIEQLRCANPPETCADLYALIAPSLGDARKERLDWFSDVCDEIGLSMKSKGRPAKSSPK